MDLPSFLWLWKIAAWAMGLSLGSYFLLAITGICTYATRTARRPQPKWLPPLHYILGICLVTLVFLLLTIGIIGTLGHFGSLGHSPHLIAGITVVILTCISAASASQIHPTRPWAKPLHLTTNAILFFAFAWVSWTGWLVVQKYLP
ncbi:DUF4079 domain-containing protein [[Phormidium] sp. ETS-05]|uniref:DUF4079 domain-containing protein n=1 Tax=[Phormidium] sp. ETS-05 TaxID=222819 RepID=UPI0018EF0D2F|nr:DUF4079 domain-containing protein [[Phormidium] sp. ETS-05]